MIENDIGPGLHFKLPVFNTVRIFDVRVQTVDVWGKLGQRTAYVAANLSTAAGGDAEQPPIFLSLLVPVSNRSKAVPLCKAASERAERGGGWLIRGIVEWLDSNSNASSNASITVSATVHSDGTEGVWSVSSH